MGKDIHKSTLDKGGASQADKWPDLSVPLVRTQRGRWNVEGAAYAHAAKGPDDAFDKFYKERQWFKGSGTRAYGEMEPTPPPRRCPCRSNRPAR